MEVQIKQVQSPDEFLDFMSLVKANTFYPDEFDCGWDGYKDFLMTRVYRNPQNYLAYVMYIQNLPIGYMLLQGPNELKNEVCMFDMYITPDEHSKKLILLFVDRAFDVCKNAGAKRLVWKSPALPEEYWMKLGKIMGVNIQTVNEYKIEFDQTFDNTQSKKVVEKINEDLQ